MKKILTIITALLLCLKMAGDLMLYGNACVVLFYGNAGGYSYTRLGKLQSTQGLAEAVGRGSVNVSFSIKPTAIETIASNPAKAGKMYDLHGKELQEESSKGIFIKTGRRLSNSRRRLS